MLKKKNKRETFPEKIIRGIQTARYKMLLEKSEKSQSVVHYDKGKIIEEKAVDILRRKAELSESTEDKFVLKTGSDCSFELRITSYKLRATSYELQITS